MQKSNWNITTAQRLRILREETGLNYTQLSDEVEKKCNVRISADSLANYEITATQNHTRANKTKGMKIEFLRALAEFYGVSSDWLLGVSEVRSSDANVSTLVKATNLSESSAKLLLALCEASRDEERSYSKIQEIFPDSPLFSASDLGKLGGEDSDYRDITAALCTNLISDILECIIEDSSILGHYLGSTLFQRMYTNDGELLKETMASLPQDITQFPNAFDFYALATPERADYSITQIARSLENYLTKKAHQEMTIRRVYSPLSK